MSGNTRRARKSSSKSSGGFELAATAAIGVGLGAALYYFTRRQPENPETQGSTSAQSSNEQHQHLYVSNSEYTTVSENTTTDTSIWVTDNDSDCSPKRERIRKNSGFKRMANQWSDSDSSVCNNCNFNGQDDSDIPNVTSDEDSSQEYASCDGDSEPDSEEHSDSNKTSTDSEEMSLVGSEVSSSSDNDEKSETSEEEEEEEDQWMSEEDAEENSNFELDIDIDMSFETGAVLSEMILEDIRDLPDLESSSESESHLSSLEYNNEWDITTSIMDVPTVPSVTSSPLIRAAQRVVRWSRRHYGNQGDRNKSPEDEQARILREKAFRDRHVSVEACAICFDAMLQEQPLMQLPCTHNFHVACIGPWLQQRQTCPVCRKAAE